jgi:hypothetical protein
MTAHNTLLSIGSIGILTSIFLVQPISRAQNPVEIGNPVRKLEAILITQQPSPEVES